MRSLCIQTIKDPIGRECIIGTKYATFTCLFLERNKKKQSLLIKDKRHKANISICQTPFPFVYVQKKQFIYESLKQRLCPKRETQKQKAKWALDSSAHSLFQAQKRKSQNVNPSVPFAQRRRKSHKWTVGSTKDPKDKTLRHVSFPFLEKNKKQDNTPNTRLTFQCEPNTRTSHLLEC